MRPESPSMDPQRKRELADARDAARYRWLRERARHRNHALELPTMNWPDACLPETADYLDAAIDAAMQAEQPGRSGGVLACVPEQEKKNG